MRITPRRKPPIAFAAGGAEPEPADSLAALQLAIKLGATGFESALRTTSDGVAVLHRAGHVRQGLRRRRVATLTAAELGDRAMTVTAALELLAPAGHLLVHIDDPSGLDALLSPESDPTRIWLATGDLSVLEGWRSRWPDVRLVNMTTLSSLTDGAERRAARLAAMDIDAVQLPYGDWTGGLVTLFHRFEVEAFGWNAPHERMLDDLVRMGCDGISTAHVDRLASALGRGGYSSFGG